MRRLVAFVLLQALVVSTATVSSLHVHEYLGHDHPEHHHGPASHEHQQLALPDHHGEDGDEDHTAMEAGPCDPGRHAVAVTLGCAHVPQVHIEIAEVAGPTVVAPIVPIGLATPITDIRVHGPPSHVRIPSRAPPLTHLA